MNMSCFVSTSLYEMVSYNLASEDMLGSVVYTPYSLFGRKQRIRVNLDSSLHCGVVGRDKWLASTAPGNHMRPCPVRKPASGRVSSEGIGGKMSSSAIIRNRPM